MNATRRLGPAVKAEVAADLNGLPYDRIAQHGDEAYVFIATGLPDLELWFLALGGRITRKPSAANPGVVVWTLTTDTDHGHGCPLRIVALALDTDQIDAACAHAIHPHAA